MIPSYSVGSVVVVKPRYERMAKSYWLYKERLQEQSASPGVVVLGGVYSVMRIYDDLSLELFDDLNHTPADLCLPSQDVVAWDGTTCVFSVGDRVEPFDFDELYYARNEFVGDLAKIIIDRNCPEGTFFEIAAIINQRYLVIDPTGSGSAPFPFWHEHFRKASGVSS